MSTKNAVVFFSATGITKHLAENIAKAADADIFEIEPLQPYTSEDLDWTNENSRSSVEMKGFNTRPEIVDNGFSVSDYDTVFLGFPIWWYIAPVIVNTFLEKYNFSNKKIILFATSGGSKFGKTLENIKLSIGTSAEVVEWDVLDPDMSVEELKQQLKKIKY